MCGNTQAKDPTVSFHRFPSDPAVRLNWLRVFNLKMSDLKPSSRVVGRGPTLAATEGRVSALYIDLYLLQKYCSPIRLQNAATS